MEIEHVRAFVAVAEEGTVSAAAHRLKLTQPAVTRQLQKLGRALDLTLFQRHPEGLALSSAGSDFLPAARRLLTEYSHTLQLAGMLSQGSFRDVTLAAPGTTLIDIVIPFVATLDQATWKPNVVESSLDSSLRDDVAQHDLVVLPSAPPRTVDSLQLQRLPV